MYVDIHETTSFMFGMIIVIFERYVLIRWLSVKVTEAQILDRLFLVLEIL